MFSKIIFYALLSITIICIASQPSDNNWFHDITHRAGGNLRDGTMLMIIKCYCLSTLPEDFSPELDFEQNDQGTLFAIYQGRKQSLGCWPDRQLKTTKAMTAWYYGERPKVEIQISYRTKTQTSTS